MDNRGERSDGMDGWQQEREIYRQRGEAKRKRISKIKLNPIIVILAVSLAFVLIGLALMQNEESYETGAYLALGSGCVFLVFLFPYFMPNGLPDIDVDVDNNSSSAAHSSSGRSGGSSSFSDGGRSFGSASGGGGHTSGGGAGRGR